MSTHAPVVGGHKPGTVEWIADRAVGNLTTGVGFSLIRLGDGEGRLLAWPDKISLKLMSRRLTYWFGHIAFNDADIAAMQAILATAIDQADVLGLCPPERGHWARVPRRYVRQIGRMNAGSVCSAAIHRELWAQGELDRIAEACERIVIITCRDVCHGLQTRYSRDVLWIDVPEEGHTSQQATDHWQQFSRIEAEIAKCAGPGVLVLVGAGVLGKAYTTTAAYCGAVALDIGSVFDGWSGVKSRSYLEERLEGYVL